MKNYFVLLFFIFAAANSSAESFLEMAKRKLEEAKQLLAQPQAAQPQAAQPQAAQPQAAQPQAAQPQAAQPQSAQPKDANSYCDNVINSAEAQKYTNRYVVLQQKISELSKIYKPITWHAKDEPEDQKNAVSPVQEALSLMHDSYELGMDDDTESKTKFLVKRLNEAIPRKDNYNQDIVMMQYLPWFSSCAAKLKDSPLKYVFLNPTLSDKANEFYQLNVGAQNSKLADLLGKPNLTPSGINPLWVTPMLFTSNNPSLSPNATDSVKRIDQAIAVVNSKIDALKVAEASQKSKIAQEEKVRSENTLDARSGTGITKKQISLKDFQAGMSSATVRKILESYGAYNKKEYTQRVPCSSTQVTIDNEIYPKADFAIVCEGSPISLLGETIPEAYFNFVNDSLNLLTFSVSDAVVNSNELTPIAAAFAKKFEAPPKITLATSPYNPMAKDRGQILYEWNNVTSGESINYESDFILQGNGGNYSGVSYANGYIFLYSKDYEKLYQSRQKKQKELANKKIKQDQDARQKDF